ncbi:hepatitis A virus cellular receptor 1 homolog [Hyperolius riggenbachi]|uniref:hepatitis A virus cellular receptor 1 homolog n=1 Tax=Hyperolius riggenbachi TaxID=752182 RepID=UPI0035A35A25
MLQTGPSLTIALLLLGSVGPAVSQTGSLLIEGVEGQPVTLPCTYKGATTTMCWGRGSCPKSQCNDVLIWTDGEKVTHRSSDRYRLNDQIQGRKVSLTITQARMDDEGTYCCRVEHAGWFNDDLFEIKLKMRKAPTTTRPPLTTTTKAPTTTTTKPPTTTTTPPSTTASTTTLRQPLQGLLHHPDLK